jgi:hypothetical protein
LQNSKCKHGLGHAGLCGASSRCMTDSAETIRNLIDQLLKSATEVGANLEEAKGLRSRDAKREKRHIG